MNDCKNHPDRGNIFNADPVPLFDNESMRAQMDAANRRLVRVIVLQTILIAGEGLLFAFLK